MRPSRFRTALPLAVLLVLSSGCATSGSSTTRSAGDTVGEEELAQYSGINVYQALQRLRPTWLRRRGGSPEVVVDGVQRGDTDVLRQITVHDVEEIRYRSPQEATMRYGTGFPYGAIEVDTKR